MNFRTLCLSIILPFALLSQGVQAQDEAATSPTLTPVQQMAEILLNMKEQPTKEQKKALETLANSNAVTTHVRNMAGVVKNIKGRVQTGDKPRLYSVFRAVSAADEERELAKIINKFNGSADSVLQTRLQRLLPPKPTPGADGETTKAPANETNEETPQE